MTDLDTRNRLLNIAGEVFAEKGFEAATVREICRRAEVPNLAAINYYFGDKDRLYQEAVRVAFKGSASPATPPEWPADMPGAHKLRAFIKAFAKMLIGDHRPAWHYHLMARELAQPSQGCMAFIRDFARPHFDVLMNVLGEVMPAQSDDVRRLTGLSIIGQVIHHRCAHTIITQIVGPDVVETYTAERIGEHVANFSLAALGLSTGD